jgi:hypothetical protein
MWGSVSKTFQRFGKSQNAVATVQKATPQRAGRASGLLPSMSHFSCPYTVKGLIQCYYLHHKTKIV